MGKHRNEGQLDGIGDQVVHNKRVILYHLSEEGE